MRFEPVLILFFICLAIIYATLIFLFYHGWQKIQTTKIPPDFRASLFLSVVVAARNEQNKLPLLLNDLLLQNYPAHLFEIIIINDHSTDATLSVLKNEQKKHTNLYFYSLPQNISGKKQAIKYAVNQTKGSFIITTDADCRISPDFIKTYAAFIAQKKPQMILAPVLMTGNNPFQQIQQVEFMSLIASTAGAAGIKHPIMSNAANMAFNKNSWKKFRSSHDENIPSGDDLFFLLDLKKNGFRDDIHFLKNINTVVKTEASPTLSDFLRQRIRWTSKSRHYFDYEIIFTAITVLTMNFSILSSLFLLLFQANYWWLFILLFFMKAIPDFLLLKNVNKFFCLKNLWLKFLVLQIIYPFYIVIIGILGNILPFVWKDRKNK